LSNNWGRHPQNLALAADTNMDSARNNYLPETISLTLIPQFSTNDGIAALLSKRPTVFCEIEMFFFAKCAQKKNPTFRLPVKYLSRIYVNTGISGRLRKSATHERAVTVLGVYLKSTCSRVTSASNALGVLTIMRYTNPRTHSLNLTQAYDG